MDSSSTRNEAITVPGPNGPITLCPDPVFIVGSPRSGTTILAHALAQHSQFWTSDESQFLWDLFEGGRLNKNYQRQERYDGSWLCKQGISRTEFLYYIGLGLNTLFSSRSNNRRWVDHTPGYSLMVDDLVELFPSALFLHIMRDGRKVVHSMINYLNRRFPDKTREAIQKSPLPPWATDFRQACKTWSVYVRKLLDFGKKYPQRYLLIRNEDLVTKPEVIWDEVFRFLHVSFEDSVIKYSRSKWINSSFTSREESQSEPDNIWSKWTSEQQAIYLEEVGDLSSKST